MSDAASWVDWRWLSAWDRNPRRHSKRQVEKIANAIRTLGWGAPLLVRTDGRLIAGHGRYEAVLLLVADDPTWRLPGAPHPGAVPARVLDVSDAQADAIALADNRIGELSDWDPLRLHEVAKSLEDYLPHLGWDDSDIERILTRPLVRDSQTGADEVDRTDTSSVVGGVYPLGQDLLVCGSAESDDTWQAVDAWLGGRRVDHVLTDPPYGIDYDGGANTARARKVHRIAGDVVLPDLGAVYERTRSRTRPGATWHVFAPASPQIVEVLGPLGDVWRHTWIWSKPKVNFGRSDRHYQHENIGYGWTPGAAHTWRGGRKLSSVIRTEEQHKCELHPTQKPVGLLVEILRTVAVEHDVVIDMFGGSGSTLAAAREIGARCALIEVDPYFSDVIRQRFGGA